MYFDTKSYLKSTRNHTAKHDRNKDSDLNYEKKYFMRKVFIFSHVYFFLHFL
jgi:hypothetical protein